MKHTAQKLNIPRLQEYIDHLRDYLTDTQKEEFDLAFRNALITGHHFLIRGTKVQELQSGEYLTPDRILDSCLDYEETPQGFSYWKDIDETLTKIRDEIEQRHRPEFMSDKQVTGDR